MATSWRWGLGEGHARKVVVELLRANRTSDAMGKKLEDGAVGGYCM